MPKIFDKREKTVDFWIKSVYNKRVLIIKGGFFMRSVLLLCAAAFLVVGCAGPEKEYPGEVKTRDSYYAGNTTRSYNQVAAQAKKRAQTTQTQQKKKLVAPVKEAETRAQERLVLESEGLSAESQDVIREAREEQTVIVVKTEEGKPVAIETEQETEKKEPVVTFAEPQEKETPSVKIVESVTEETTTVTEEKGVEAKTSEDEAPSVVVVYEEKKPLEPIVPVADLSPADTEKLAQKEAPTPDAIAMVLAILDSDAQALNALIKVGGDAKAKSETGETFLFTAAKYSVDPDVIDVLVENGAQINDQDIDGRTPLMIGARYTTTPAVVFRMLDLGADPSIKDKNGDTALEYARNNPNGQTIYEELKSRQNPKYLKIAIIVLSIFVLILLWRRKK